MPAPGAEGARERLLEAAGPVFAEHGFEGATVRQLASQAGVNIAAVSYHFGDKAGLYRACITEGFGAFHRVATDHQSLIEPEREPERALQEWLGGMVERSLGPGKPQWLNEVMMREMVRPTDVLGELVQSFMRPQQQRAARAAGALMGCDPDDARVVRAVYSMVAQVLFYKHCRHVVARLVPVDVSTAQARAQLARHIIAFSLAGLRALRDGPGPATGGGAV
jgi:AcrR family transcriptional regulator